MAENSQKSPAPATQPAALRPAMWFTAPANLDLQTMAACLFAQESAPSLSPNARVLLNARYLRKDEHGEVIERPQDLFHRVASAVAAAEWGYGVPYQRVEAIQREFYEIMATLQFLPNSPALMNAGRGTGMISACFVIPVEDSIDGIFTAVKNTAIIQQAGGGTGFSFSRLRPTGDIVHSSGGRTSGPLAFMRVFSEATNAIQQGAFRRGANMGLMRIDHPDIVNFIEAKQNLSELTNFNLSVAITDEFMTHLHKQPGRVHITYNPRNGQAGPILKEDGSFWTVGELFLLVVQRAWQTGEPGVVFIDRINQANPTSHIGEIEAVNACAEQPLQPYESCNLGSINLNRFVMGGPTGPGFDFAHFRHVIHTAARFLDNMIDINRYPLPEIASITRGNRKIGLGVMGFADTLCALAIPYDSEEAVKFGSRLMAFMNEESHKASQQLAGERGTFPNWKGSRWDERGIPMRNACTTTVAPTGSLSIIAGCSGGIEPFFSLAFTRNVLDRQLTEVNPHFEQAVRARNLYTPDLMREIAEAGGSIQRMQSMPEDLRRLFVTAHDIAPEWHVRMQAAFQQHCDASISKTVNLPEDATPADVRRVFLLAHKLGCKGSTVFRDRCRDNQPMAHMAPRTCASGTCTVV